METVILADSNSDAFHRGIQLFNHAEFFDAHEVLEDVWRASLPAEKKFLQGLIQVAVAFHHHSRKNVRGMRSLLERAINNLAECPDDFRDIQLPSLRQSLVQWREALDNNLPLPQLPRMEMGKKSI